jgi:hypothetical protein
MKCDAERRPFWHLFWVGAEVVGGPAVDVKFERMKLDQSDLKLLTKDKSSVRPCKFATKNKQTHSLLPPSLSTSAMTRLNSKFHRLLSARAGCAINFSLSLMKMQARNVNLMFIYCCFILSRLVFYSEGI